jgi:hypothetical protein
MGAQHNVINANRRNRNKRNCDRSERVAEQVTLHTYDVMAAAILLFLRGVSPHVLPTVTALLLRKVLQLST